MTSKIKLPKTPTVIATDKIVMIQFGNGSEILWGKEETTEEAIRIAKELEIELKAVKYVKWHVHNFIKDMKKYLNSLGIEEGLLNSILVDGHAFARKELNKNTLDSIIMSADRELRKQVFDNISSTDYIV